MKNQKISLTLLSLISLVILCHKPVFAMNTGFSTETFPEKNIDALLENVNLSLLTQEPTKDSIECFDIGENGLIAIGTQTSEKKTVCIYGSDGRFQYGYTFTSSGSFGIEIDGDTLIIYFVRSDIAISVNSEGEIEEILKIQNTIENTSYWNNSVNARTRKVGDTEYTVKNNMGILNLFASSYSMLTAKTADGTETVIYDVSTSQLANTIFILIGMLLFVTIVVLSVVIQFKRTIRNI